MNNKSQRTHYNDKVAQQLFALLRAGLWNQSEDTSLFEGSIDWQRIMNLTEEQTVLALAFDGVELLPREYHPGMDTLMNWLGQASYI